MLPYKYHLQYQYSLYSLEEHLHLMIICGCVGKQLELGMHQYGTYSLFTF